MTTAFVADIHGNLPALEAVAADIRRRGVSRVVNLGDSLSGPLLPRETAEFLRSRDWLHVAGNHDRNLIAPPGRPLSPEDAFARACLDEPLLAWLAALPDTLRPSPDLLYCHATPHNNHDYLLEWVTPEGQVRVARDGELALRLDGEAAHFIACGHTHRPRVVRTRSGTLIVNPGSVGRPAYDDDHPVAHGIENGSPDARYALVEETEAGRVVSLITVPYDHESMAQLAADRGFPDWALALRTGYCTRR